MADVQYREIDLCEGCLSSNKLCKNIRAPQWIPATKKIPGMWKIDVPCEENHLWSIILGYIVQKNELPKIVHSKFDDCYKDNVLDQVAFHYNPFINKYSYVQFLKFVDECRNLLCKTDLKFEDESSLTHGVFITKTKKTITKSYDFLDCGIQILKCKDSGAVSQISWADSQTFANGYLCLIQSEGSSRLSFALNKDTGSTLQESALRVIFNECRQLVSSFEVKLEHYPKGNSFSISLLENELYDIVKSLYKFPPYIFVKMRDAGFNTDIKQESGENGKSVFYYAVMAKDFELLLTLYHYAANYSMWWKLTDREFTERNKQNMVDLKKILENTREQLKYDESCGENFRLYSSYLDQLLWINAYRLELVNQLEADENNDDFRRTDKKHKAERLCKDISKILETYTKHFHGYQTDEHSAFSRYKSYYEYFNYIDVFTASLFFDYSNSLKATYKLKEEAYEKMESALCQFLFFCRGGMNEEFEVFTPKEQQQYFEFRKRLELKSELESFLSVLQTTPVENRYAEVQKEEIDVSPAIHDVLRSVPVLQGHYLLYRLMGYFELFEKIDDNTLFETANDNKKLLYKRSITKRVLQVVGETVICNQKTSATVIKSLLVSAFPLTVAKQLFQLRQDLSHYNEGKHQPLECKMEDFSEIIEDIEYMKMQFKHIERVERFMLHKYFLENIKNLTYVSEIESSEKDLCENIAEKAKWKIGELNSIFYKDLKESIRIYEVHFENHFDQVRAYCDEIEETKAETNVESQNKINPVKEMSKKLEYFACLYNFFAGLVSEMDGTIDSAEITAEDYLLPENISPEDASKKAVDMLKAMRNKQTELFHELGFEAGDAASIKARKFLLIEKCFLSFVTEEDCQHIKNELCEIQKEKEKLFYIEPLGSGNKVKWFPEIKRMYDKIIHHLETALQVRALSETSYNELCNILDTKEETKDVFKKLKEASPPHPLEFLLNRLNDFKGVIETKFHRNEMEKHKFIAKFHDDKGTYITMEHVFFESILMLKQVTKQHSNETSKASEETESHPVKHKKTTKTKNPTEKANVPEKMENPSKRPKTPEKTENRPERPKTSEKTITPLQMLKTPAKTEKSLEKPKTPSKISETQSSTVMKDSTDKTEKPLEALWKKGTRLFYGMDLRNMLAHGNSLFDAVTDLTDETHDIMCELVDKVISLLQDQRGIAVLKELDERTTDPAEVMHLIIHDDCSNPQTINKMNYDAKHYSILFTNQNQNQTQSR